MAVLGGHSVLSFYSPAPTLTPGASPPDEEPADLEREEKRTPQPSNGSGKFDVGVHDIGGWVRVMNTELQSKAMRNVAFLD